MEKADGWSPAGNDCAEIIILHFMMTYQAPQPGEEEKRRKKKKRKEKRIDEEN